MPSVGTPAGAGSTSQAPAPAGTGVDGLLEGPDLRKGQQPTFYEKYGANCCSKIDTDLGPIEGLGDRAVGGLVAMLWGLTVWLMRAAISLFQWAFSLDLGQQLGSGVEAATSGLRQLIYSPYVLLMVVLAGAWLLWQGILRRRASVAAEGTIWAVFALVLGLVVTGAPRTLLNGADAVSTGLSRQILGAVSVGDPKTNPDDGVSTRPTFGGDAADTQLRASADRMWRSFVWVPWTALEFGSVDAGRQYGQRLLDARTTTPDEAAQLYKDGVSGDVFGARDVITSQQRAEQEVLTEIKAEADLETREWFQGKRAIGRLGVASLAMVSALFMGGFVALLAASVFFAHLALIILVVLAPLFLLLAVHPGAGRVVGIRWIELIVALTLKRVGYAALLAVVLVLCGAIAGTTYPLGWGIAMALQIMVVATGIWYRKPFTFLFTGAARISGGPDAVAEFEARQRPHTLRTSMAVVSSAVWLGHVRNRRHAQRVQAQQQRRPGPQEQHELEKASARSGFHAGRDRDRARAGLNGDGARSGNGIPPGSSSVGLRERTSKSQPPPTGGPSNGEGTHGPEHRP
jgi:hypothetical protein